MKKVALVSLASLVLFACSSDPGPSTAPGGQGTKSSTSPTDKDGDDNDDLPGSPSTPGSAPGGSSSSGTPGTPGATPGGEDACYDACDAQNPAGVQAMDGVDDQWTSCVCGACAAACGQSLCAANPTEPVDGDACDTCMQNAQTCHDAWETSCNANADCKKLDTCQIACEPPDADDGGDADDAQDKTSARSRIGPAHTVLLGLGSKRVVVRRP